MQAIRVLVVDDSPFIHRAVAKALKDDGRYELVGTAGNGKEGCEKYFGLKPDVTIMDITMPVMDGLAAAREILSKDSQAKIIFQSALGDDELVAKAKELGVKDFIQKPFKDGDLKSVIRRVCACPEC